MTMPPLVVSSPEARAISLRAQGLAEDAAPFGPGKAGALKAVEHLGYVQMDTISVVQRAHHHVLWSRVPDYVPGMLHEMQSADASVFEYWNHASSFLPMRHYRFSLPLMRKHRSGTHWGHDTPELRRAMRSLLARIRRGGPLRIGEVESKGTHSSGWNDTGMGTGKIERMALHELWMRGQIMIRSRQGMEKVFDLPDRVLPAGTDRRVPKAREAAAFHVRRSLRALGIAQARELPYLQDSADAATWKAALQEFVERGEVVELRLDEAPKVPLYALRSSLDEAAPVKRAEVRFLSPFDNLVIQRKRLGWLFGFDYVVEMYVPAAKRRYGYFALPILWGDRLIGRLDAKAFRAERRLAIHNLVFEPSFRDFAAVKEPFRRALDDFSRFQGCDTLQVARVEPKGFRVS